MQQYQLNVESRSTALQNETTTITNNYKERTKESKAQYQEYKMKDEKNSKEIRDTTIYINRITVSEAEANLMKQIKVFFSRRKLMVLKVKFQLLKPIIKHECIKFHR
jgi:hypothetical protein